MIGCGWRAISYRLFGIDAPESKQTCSLAGNAWDCGKEATAAISRLVGDKPITCQERDRDRYKRIVAVCYLNGQDINEAIVGKAGRWRTGDIRGPMSQPRMRPGKPWSGYGGGSSSSRGSGGGGGDRGMMVSPLTIIE